MMKSIKLIELTKNIKHKAILMVTYSAGLRVSETANLKIRDIDSDSKTMKICEGKD